MPRTNPLAKYNAKRDFAKTTEPRGTPGSSAEGHLFIVQKHAATRLHWDLRLEVDGVLKSWAVTRGPSPDPADKRLAVRTEDHPLAYAEFEGTIPAGEYGGGTVMLWDKGTWEPVPGKSAKDLANGHLHFVLHGKRMKGEWLLIRLKPRGHEKRENWLLRKLEDTHAKSGDALVERELTSVLTGRPMAQIAADPQATHSLAGKRGKAFADEMAAAAHRNARVVNVPSTSRSKVTLPKFRPVQLATLVDAVPAGNQWFHEIKFDGYRALIAVARDKVRVYTRSGLDWTEKFAPLARAISALNLPAALIDGEIVASDDQGNPDFSALQGVLKRGHGAQTEATPLAFHAFDLLELAGEDLADLPNIERKERLASLLAHAPPPVHVADHVIGAGEKLLATLCSAGQEGIISKLIGGHYQGRRSRDWLKVKCVNRQEFVVIGWKRSTAKGRPFSSLLLAQHDGGKLAYKGRVGTGFDGPTMENLSARMRRFETRQPPVEVPTADGRDVTWLRPELVAEIAFAEFTAEGSVRHASFIGLRADKPAKAVKPERAAPVPEPEAAAVPITNRDRVIFSESGQTKGNLADYYAAIAPQMLTFAANRPVSLVRCPQGRARKCFFQKHDSGSFGGQVHHVAIADKDGGTEDYLWFDEPAGIRACVQMGTIEFHGWASRASAVEQPDRMIFDLDPDEALGFDEVRRAARDIRDRLSELGLVSFAMLSGGKGVHVVVPVLPGHSWDKHKDFAQRFAQALTMAEPDRFTANLSKAKRQGRIFVDYLRNQRGSTAILPYSVRAREGAPVAVPIAWDELDDFADAHPFTIDDTAKLLKRSSGAALKGWGFAAQKLPDV